MRVFLILILLLVSFDIQAQIADYSEATVSPSVSFENLNLTIEPDTSENTLKGVATWQIRLIDQKPDSLSFNLFKGVVNSVRIDEESVAFSYQFDRLTLEVPESSVSDSLFKIEINYSSEPVVGLHIQDDGLHWTSTLPGSRSDIFPTIQSPSIRVTTDIRVIVPNSWKAVSNGFSAGSTLLHDDRRLYHWKSTVPISLADIVLVYGPLDISTIRFNNMEINVFSASSTEPFFNKASIFQNASLLLQQSDSLLSKPFPYEALNIILVNDHLWEFKSASAGVVYLFKNSGSMENQLSKAIAATYFGSYHKPFTLADSDHIVLNQVRLFDLLNQGSDPSGFQLDYPSHNDTWSSLSPHNWYKAYNWVRNFGRGNSLFESKKLGEILSYGTGSFSSDDYLAMLQSNEFTNYPDFINPGYPDTSRIEVIYTHDYQNQRISIEFLPRFVSSSLGDLIPVKIRQYTDGSSIDLEFQISRFGDRISVNTNGFTNNMYILNDDPLIDYHEVKPAEFWRFQLRNDSDYIKRLEAARGFGRVVDDPDIQLFLQDLVRSEPDELVRERLVQSYAQLTKGDRGTHQRFIGWLTDDSERVRSASLEALMSYPGNADVLSAVYKIISTSQDISFVNHAIEVYFEIATPEEFFATGRGLLVEDQKDLLFTATVLPLIIKTEQGLAFAPNLMQYLEAEFPFFIRNIAFQILKDVEISASYWQDLLPMLATDPDPRVRYLSAQLLDKIDSDMADDILSEWVQKEYDVRVLQQLQEMLSKR